MIAVGGGSALDVGKCVAFMVAQSRPVWDFEDVGDWWTRANTDGVAPTIAVPTTAGTGSEVGRAGVITREDTHVKKIIFHPLMLPKIAIEDPELAVGLPPFLTMATGMDALAHCFEAYCVNAFHPLADGVALEGIKIIDTYLPRFTQSRMSRDIEARAYMFAAASMGATAFQKGLGAIHSVSHPVGARYDTHHGLTNGVVFPYVLACNRAAIADKIPHIARALDLPGRDFDAVLSWILAFRKKLGVPHTLAELGVKEADAGIIAADAVLKDPTASSQSAAIDASGVRATDACGHPRRSGRLGCAADLLVVEGNTPAGRRRIAESAGATPAESYAAVLRGIASDAIVDICTPADDDATTPQPLDSYHGIAITGSSLNIYQRDIASLRQIDFVREVFARGIPMFGSCWGLQLATVAAGGEVGLNPGRKESCFRAQDPALTPCWLAIIRCMRRESAVFDAPAILQRYRDPASPGVDHYRAQCRERDPGG